eukprot:4573335-Amphidinium_carterae.2
MAYEPSEVMRDAWTELASSLGGQGSLWSTSGLRVARGALSAVTDPGSGQDRGLAPCAGKALWLKL